MTGLLNKYISVVDKEDPIHYVGKVFSVKGLLVSSRGPVCVIGEICQIELASGQSILAEVVGLNENTVQLAAFSETKGIEVGCNVIASGHIMEVAVGEGLLGRVIDATGKPYDNKPDITPDTYYPAVASPPNPMSRLPINKRITTGVRAIDALLTCGKGQRLGIFAGSGVGKSTLMSIIARNTNADINVIGLIGERGREVMDFIKRDLGTQGLKRSVVVVATSDQPAIARLRAAYVATSVAEYFRDKGKDVMLMLDSVTRFAHAQREIGLANGEPPAQRGFPPSVFDSLPKLLERTGTNDKGSITAFYTVLVDGDDMDEPITDKVRGTLDGHIVLSRKLAQKGHYPAIDILASVSRLSKRVTGKQTQQACNMIRQQIALYEQNEDMITAGVYQKGVSPQMDKAIDMHPAIEEFLCQDEYSPCAINDTLKKLSSLTSIEIQETEYSETPAGAKVSPLSS